MSVEILAIKPQEAHAFCEKLYDLSADGIGFPEEALHHYRSIWTTDAIAQAARNRQHVLIAAWEGETMVGLLLGAPSEGGVGTIIWVLVARDYQRQGIGRRLFAEACRRYRGMGSHKVKLTVPNKKTVQFYEKQGMHVEGFHVNHWWHMDVWSMGKIL